MTLKFSIAEYKKLKNFDKLSETTVDLMHLINEYRKKLNLRCEVVIRLVDDLLQLIEKDTSVIYKVCFYVSLFNPLENSSIVNKKTLNRKTIEKLVNEILLTDMQENEDRLDAFAKENNIKRN